MENFAMKKNTLIFAGAFLIWVLLISWLVKYFIAKNLHKDATVAVLILAILSYLAIRLVKYVAKR